MENHVPITADLGYLYLGGTTNFEWVLIFEKSVAIASMGTYICGGTCIRWVLIHVHACMIPCDS